MPLYEAMTKEDPESRPSASEAFAMFKELRVRVGFWTLHSSLHSKEDNAITHRLKDLLCLASDGYYITLRTLEKPAQAGSKLRRTLLQRFHNH